MVFIGIMRAIVNLNTVIKGLLHVEIGVPLVVQYSQGGSCVLSCLLGELSKHLSRVGILNSETQAPIAHSS